MTIRLTFLVDSPSKRAHGNAASRLALGLAQTRPGRGDAAVLQLGSAAIVASAGSTRTSAGRRPGIALAAAAGPLPAREQAGCTGHPPGSCQPDRASRGALGPRAASDGTESSFLFRTTRSSCRMPANRKDNKWLAKAELSFR